MEKPDIATASKEQLSEYIEWANKIITGHSEMEVQLALLRNSVASEVKQVNEGITTGLKILKGDDKLFEKLSTILKNKTDWCANEFVVSDEKPTAKRKANIQDFVLKPK